MTSRLAVAGTVLCAALATSCAPKEEAGAPRDIPGAGELTAAPTPPTFLDDATYPRWRVAAEDEPYTAINGVRLKGFVADQVAIAHRSRERGEQWWGRIIGSDADAESAAWMAEKLREAGVPDVRIQELDLPPQWRPVSWQVSVSLGPETVTLESAMPFTRTAPTPNDGLDLELVYVGLGTPADYLGRDVRGKAVLIHSVARQNAWQHGAQRNGSVERAVDGGAAAVLVAIGMPGNRKTQTSVRGALPDDMTGFALGEEDGGRIRATIERAALSGGVARASLRLDTTMVDGLTTANVWGVIPGTTDEDVVVIAHRDGYFEAANDNATGVASAIGVAEYFMRVPAAERRRTIKIIGTPGHHNGGAAGIEWLAEHRDTELANTALLINFEHTAAAHVNLYGPRHRATNMPVTFHWFVGVGSELEPRVFEAWDAFGVPRYTDRDARPAGEIGRIFRFAPSLQLIEGGMYYHTDQDSLETIPPSGLENTTRSYAKIIDQVNSFDRSQLRSPEQADP
ncbi:MAG TPA: M28 family peptidase [Vicinamibacterales bacterium]|jgi:hypothetical protein|nr:M28 family peptidase [Vicinamibacterales bacterium]MDP7691092.1 M28 family peptidase [Vicinamibacterales bacterium]HJN42792.1 M28 family peptidase [Vicinamibacterales bacterium]